MGNKQQHDDVIQSDNRSYAQKSLLLTSWTKSNADR